MVKNEKENYRFHVGTNLNFIFEDVKVSKITLAKKKRKTSCTFSCFQVAQINVLIKAISQICHRSKEIVMFFAHVSRGCTFSALNMVYCYDKKWRPA